MNVATPDFVQQRANVPSVERAFMEHTAALAHESHHGRRKSDSGSLGANASSGKCPPTSPHPAAAASCSKVLTALDYIYPREGAYTLKTQMQCTHFPS